MPKVTIREGWREEILSVRARSGAEQHLRSCGFDSDDTWLCFIRQGQEYALLSLSCGPLGPLLS